MIDHNLYNSIIQVIEGIETDYQDNQGLLLTEDDFKCQIYKRVSSLMSIREETMDNNIYGSPIHTELPFYDDNDKLTIRPDITIFDPKELSILHGVRIYIKNNKLAYGKLPSKSCEFGGKTIVIEIKFYRGKSGISKKNLLSIEKDIVKILNLLQRHNRPASHNDILGIMVVFNKTDKKNRVLNRLITKYASHSRLRVVYGTGKVNI